MELMCKAGGEMTEHHAVLSGGGVIDGQQVTLKPPPCFGLPDFFLMDTLNLTG